jgi:hypothetical protein
MSTGYYKLGIARPSVGSAHPFKINIGKQGKKQDGTPQYTLAVNYHSRLYIGMKLREKYLSYEKVRYAGGSQGLDFKSIKGLDFAELVPQEFPKENIYCVLELKISDLKVTNAQIKYVIDDKNEDELDPIVFESADNLKQVGARAIIGILVMDDEVIAGLDASEAKTPYIVQLVNTNLMMANMVFDGIPIIYPVPFIGGRLNDEFGST